MKRFIIGLATLLLTGPLPGLVHAQVAAPTSKHAAYQEAVADLTDAFRARRYVPRHEQQAMRQVSPTPAQPVQQVVHATPVRSRVIMQDGEPADLGEVLPSQSPTPSPMVQSYPQGYPGYGGEVIIPGPAPVHEVIGEGCGCDAPGGGCATGACGVGPSCGDCGHCGQCCIPCPRIWWDRFSFWGGVHSFKSPFQQKLGGQQGVPLDAETSSFGFHEGINYSTPLACIPWFEGQIGFQAYQSNFDTSPNYTINDTRSTYFITAGIFHRIALGDCGVQGGLVVDYMQDEWMYELELLQLRGELSYVFKGGHEFGFWFANSINDATDDLGNFFPNQDAQSLDLYTFFYRRRALLQGGEGRLFLGWSGDQDTYLGADFALPLNDCFAIETGFAYLIPGNDQEDPNAPAFAQEDGWNLQINLVFYPSGKARLNNDCNRPLLPVANPGNFIPDLTPF